MVLVVASEGSRRNGRKKERTVRLGRTPPQTLSTDNAVSSGDDEGFDQFLGFTMIASAAHVKQKSPNAKYNAEIELTNEHGVWWNGSEHESSSSARHDVDNKAVFPLPGEDTWAAWVDFRSGYKLRNARLQSGAFGNATRQF